MTVKDNLNKIQSQRKMTAAQKMTSNDGLTLPLPKAEDKKRPTLKRAQTGSLAAHVLAGTKKDVHTVSRDSSKDTVKTTTAANKKKAFGRRRSQTMQAGVVNKKRNSLPTAKGSNTSPIQRQRKMSLPSSVDVKLVKPTSPLNKEIKESGKRFFARKKTMPLQNVTSPSSRLAALESNIKGDVESVAKASPKQQPHSPLKKEIKDSGKRFFARKATIPLQDITSPSSRLAALKSNIKGDLENNTPKAAPQQAPTQNPVFVRDLFPQPKPMSPRSRLQACR